MPAPTIKNIARLFDVANNALFHVCGMDDYQRTLEAISKLSDLVHEFDGDTSDLWAIGEHTEASLDSLLVGAYWFCRDYHNGQWSDEYRLLCNIGRYFSPGCTNGPETDSSERDVYLALEQLLES